MEKTDKVNFMVCFALETTWPTTAQLSVGQVKSFRSDLADPNKGFAAQMPPSLQEFQAAI